MSEAPEILEQVIRSRVTEKVLCNLEDSASIPADVDAANREIILKALETAGWAPFHFARKIDGCVEPWRAHVLWSDEARKAAKHLVEELGIRTKEPMMAAACGALVIVTWIPEVAASEAVQEKTTMRNEEHVAATAAMVQNLMLLLTAHGMGTYWSSGGKFRDSEMFEYLGIPADQRLLAALFIEFPEQKQADDSSTQRKPGALRKLRTTNWIRDVKS